MDNFKKKPVLKTFLLSFFIYSIALQTVILVATYFGESEVNWSDEEKTSGLIISILIIQLIAVLGSILAAFFSKKIGNLNTLILFNLLWSGLCIYGYFVYEPIQFMLQLLLWDLQWVVFNLYLIQFFKFLPKATNTHLFLFL